MKLAKSLIKVALKYHITDMVVLLAKDLRNHCAQHEENIKEYQKYNDIYNRHIYYLLKEHKMENSLNLFAIELKLEHSSNNNSHKLKYQSLLDTRNDHFGCTPTYRYNLIYYIFTVNILTYLNKYQEILSLNYQARTFFNNLPFKPTIIFYLITRRDAMVNLQLKNYSHAIDNFLKIMDTPRNGSVGWYYNRIYFVLANLHFQQYETANDIIIDCISNRKFKTLFSPYKQYVLILNGFCEFVKLSRIQSHKSSFRIGKFLNEVPVYAKEKRGMNIAILIIHFLFLIRQKKYSRAIDRVEAMDQYCYRYLRKDENFRSNCFIKMLIQVTKADFNPIRAQRYAHKYHKKLLSVPMEIADQPIDVEIVPYEDLWEMVLRVLEQNKKTT
jgi:hypothetical protein